MKYILFNLAIVSLFTLASCSSRNQQTKLASNNSETVTEESSERNMEENAAAESKDMNSEEFAETIVISLSKTPCFGACPTFNFTVFANGMAYYEGLNNVEKKGKFKAELSKTAINQLLNEASSAGYFSLNDTYDNPAVTDLPSTITYLNMEGKEKKVLCRYQCDNRINKVNKMIEAMIQKTTWKSVE
jgi:hypothetical protein